MTLRPLESGGFFLHPDDLLLDHSWSGSSGPLSRSVWHTRWCTGSRLPGGTTERLLQNVASRILISVENQSTPGTPMRPDRQTLLDPLPAPRTVLRGELRGYRKNCNVLQPPIVPYPGEKAAPGRITDTLGQMMILHHILYLQGFVGNQGASRNVFTVNEEGHHRPAGGPPRLSEQRSYWHSPAGIALAITPHRPQ